jgi:hypothetical protein
VLMLSARLGALRPTRTHRSPYCGTLEVASGSGARDSREQADSAHGSGSRWAAAAEHAQQQRQSLLAAVQAPTDLGGKSAADLRNCQGKS